MRQPGICRQQTVTKAQDIGFFVIPERFTDNILTIAGVKQIGIAIIAPAENVITHASRQDIAAGVVTEHIVAAIAIKNVITFATLDLVIATTGMNFTALTECA